MPAKVMTLVADSASSARQVQAAAPVTLLNAAALQGMQRTGGCAAVAIQVMTCEMALPRGLVLKSLRLASEETHLLSWHRSSWSGDGVSCSDQN